MTLIVGLFSFQSYLKKGFIRAFPFYYAICSFLLYIQGQTTLFLFDSKNLTLSITLTLIVLTIANYLLITLLCFLYNLSFSTCSPISYNHLCTRFNLEIMCTSLFSKILTAIVPYVVSVQMKREK